MKLYILNENCRNSGCEADAARAYDGCGDVTVYEGEPRELLDLADLQTAHARPGGGGLYDRCVANTIREAVYADHPSLRPADEEIEIAE